MKTKLMMVAALAMLISGALMAEESTLKGSKSPNFNATKLLNPPADGLVSLNDCLGEVILVKLWGVKCGPCRASMPDVQGLWNKYEGKGLHVFMLERQGHSEEQIKDVYIPEKLTFPQVLEGDFGGFRGVGTIPYAYVIGVDGTVIFEGHSGYGGAIDTEIKKVKYLGLGKPDVAKDVEKAAIAYGAGSYGAARDEAVKAKDKKGDDPSVAADAQFIIDKVDAKVTGIQSKIEAAKTAKRYHDAERMLTDLSGKAFKGLEAADKAATDLKDLRADKAVQKELKAWKALAVVTEADKKNADGAAKKRNLEAFARKNEGTAAAEEASRLAAEITTG